ncbi:major royal jelly protein 5-like, partial [Macrosteles quadrilineatus]
LAKSSLLVPSGEPSWEPFPSWQAQTENDSNGLQNVIDVVLEQSPKNTLWVLDNGIVDTLTAPKLKCAPKIVGFDPTNGKRLHTIELKEFILPHSRLQYLAVDTDSTGQITLFVSDAGANAVIVYNLDKDSGYRAVLPEVISDGCKASGDILYIATIKNKPGVNKLYLTYHCGNGIYSLNVADLRAGTTEGTLEVVSQNKPEKMIIIGTATSAGVLYFRYDKDPNVYSWCVDEELTKENVKEIHHGESSLLATHAVLDPLRNRVRILLSNFLDFLKGSVGVGAVQVLRAVS